MLKFLSVVAKWNFLSITKCIVIKIKSVSAKKVNNYISEYIKILEETINQLDARMYLKLTIKIYL